MVSQGSLSKFWRVFSTEQPFLAYLLADADFSYQAAPLLSDIVARKIAEPEAVVTVDVNSVFIAWDA